MSQTAFNVVRTRTNTCATCGSPIRRLDGAMAGSSMPDGWHHGHEDAIPTPVPGVKVEAAPDV